MSRFVIDDEHVLLLDDADDHWVAGKCVWLSGGYANVRLSTGCAGAKRVFVHRLVVQPAPDELIDHINRNRLDCTRANLRIATRSQNLCNRGKAKHNKSGYKGVYFCKQTQRWRAEIRFNNQRVKIGRFDSLIVAAQAYDAMAVQMHGEFAYTNFGPRGDA